MKTAHCQVGSHTTRVDAFRGSRFRRFLGGHNRPVRAITWLAKSSIWSRLVNTAKASKNASSTPDSAYRCNLSASEPTDVPGSRLIRMAVFSASGSRLGVGAGLDDVAAEGEPVHDRGAESRVGEGLGPAA